MTDYSDMQAGAGMDALVAEKVMGWTVAGRCWWTGSRQRQMHYWIPSTDDGMALRVVDKLGADGWESYVSYDPNDDCELGAHAASFSKDCGEGDFRWTIGLAHTRALAICRAALMTTGDTSNGE